MARNNNKDQPLDLAQIQLKNVIKAIEIFEETDDPSFINIAKIVKIPMILIILVSALVGSLYVSFAKGLTQ
jgi:uncharacterized integral membrane protein